MLLYKNRIHLADNEVRRITLLTGEAPQPTMAIEDYHGFLDRQLVRFRHDEIRSLGCIRVCQRDCPLR